MNRLLAWAQKNERRLGGVLFLGGFVTDLLTFTLLEVSYVNLFFIAYLALASVCVFGSHLLFARKREGQSKLERALAVLFSLGSQYAIGGILSGCLIFYTKSAVLSVSWPFIVLLALVFIGNEYFRKYREHLIFQTVLLYFALYAYAIFALPIYLHALGPWIFAASTAASLAVFAAFLFLLKQASASRLRQSLKPILLSVASMTVAIVGAYATAAIPPIPLTLPESGMYHGLVRSGGDYVVLAEEAKPWWDPRPQTLHLTEGGTAYAYASVFAPTRFSASVVHHWERYDAAAGKWVNEGRISFGIAGGRDGGYRGYSERSGLSPGKWRVSVETPAGQTIGRIPFVVERVMVQPALHEETH
ncbi:MAG TPA: DUF2914 domain-containing protein [Candidatus Paceibacterota bacterium]|nr:DUF2914 domain-containing protein [Candidatus Paceibacterota bacterium]